MIDLIREQSLERSLPNSAEAERAILGGIILDNLLMPQTIEVMKPEDFYIPSHRRIFVAMVGLFERGLNIDPILIGEELKKENALESVGGISHITNLTYGLPHSTNIEHYAQIVRGKSLLRQLIREANRITQDALEEEDDPGVVLDRAEHGIFQLSDERTRSGFTHVKPIMEEALEVIQAQEGRASVLTGLPTGFAEFDKLTAGLQKQDFIILAARPSMGKTSFAIMLAENVARLVSGAVVGIFSLEMSKAALAMRLLCADGNIDSQRLRNGFLSKPEWSQVAKSFGALGESKIFIDDTASISLLEMRAKARRLKAEQGRLDLLITDYAQLADMGQMRNESKNDATARFSRGQKALAKELDVPNFMLSQLTRGPEMRVGHRPQLSDLRDSGAWEQDADVVAFIYRPEQYMTYEQRDSLPDDEKSIAEVIVAKQRNGPTDVVRLRWTPSSMRFDNIYRG